MSDGTTPGRPRGRQAWHWATVVTGPQQPGMFISAPANRADFPRGTGMSPNSPQFRSAQRAGKKYQPGGGS